VSEPGVERRLYDEAFVFDFFQAVRLLQRLAPGRARVGHTGPPANEVVRFRALPSLTFPASTVHEVLPRGGGRTVPAMTVTFLGLTGPSGVLPRHYTELIMRLERERKGEERRAFREWLDLFNHRVLALFYRAWEKYRFWLAYERGEPDQPEPDHFTTALYSLVGFGTGGLRGRLRVSAVELGRERERRLAAVEDLTLLHYAGLLAQRKRNASALEALLSDYFGVPARVEQFVGQWLALEPGSQTRLGVPDGNNDLGLNTLAGERVHDIEGKIRVRLGPLDYRRFLDFLPDRSPAPEHKAFFLLVHLVRLYVGPTLDFDVQLVLRADAVPECQLSDEAPGPRLGWNTWLQSQQPGRDAHDALFAADEVVLVDETTAIRI
jgi:type VI secretion system protein ImpH